MQKSNGDDQYDAGTYVVLAICCFFSCTFLIGLLFDAMWALSVAFICGLILGLIMSEPLWHGLLKYWYHQRHIKQPHHMSKTK